MLPLDSSVEHFSQPVNIRAGDLNAESLKLGGNRSEMKSAVNGGAKVLDYRYDLLAHPRSNREPRLTGIWFKLLDVVTTGCRFVIAHRFRDLSECSE